MSSTIICNYQRRNSETDQLDLGYITKDCKLPLKILKAAADSTIYQIFNFYENTNYKVADI